MTLIALKKATVPDRVIQTMVAKNCGEPVTSTLPVKPSPGQPARKDAEAAVLSSTPEAVKQPASTAAVGAVSTMGQGKVTGNVMLVTSGGDLERARLADVYLCSRRPGPGGKCLAKRERQGP